MFKEVLSCLNIIFFALGLVESESYRSEHKNENIFFFPINQEKKLSTQSFQLALYSYVIYIYKIHSIKEDCNLIFARFFIKVMD